MNKLVPRAEFVDKSSVCHVPAPQTSWRRLSRSYPRLQSSEVF